MNTEHSNRKSPLKRSNRRLPGQSLDDEIKEVRDRFFSESAIPAVIAITFAVLEWIRWSTDAKPNPVLFGIIGVIFLCWAAYRYKKSKEKVRRLTLGRNGERAVGQALDVLRPDGYVVFHDIQGEDWNIDHVLVGPSGVYTIETKTLMKPKRGQAKVFYQGDNLNNSNVDMSKFLIQARAQSNTIKRLLDEYAHGDFPVRPVILFPGWYVESDTRENNTTWVLEPKAFLKWVRNAKSTLSEQSQKSIKQVLDIRSSQ